MNSNKKFKLSKEAKMMADAAEQIREIYKYTARLEQKVTTNITTKLAQELRDWEDNKRVAIKLLQLFISQGLISQELVNSELTKAELDKIKEYFEEVK